MKLTHEQLTALGKAGVPLEFRGSDGTWRASGLFSPTVLLKRCMPELEYRVKPGHKFTIEQFKTAQDAGVQVQCFGDSAMWILPNNHGWDFTDLTPSPAAWNAAAADYAKLEERVAAAAGIATTFADARAAAATPVGDVNSTERGSGARANAGKPTFELIPFRVQAEQAQGSSVKAVLHALADFQERKYEAPGRALREALRCANGWETCAMVFDFGSKKYAAWNWAKGMKWSVVFGCLSRHLQAIDAGESIDKDSGKPHWGHVVCNLVMLATFARTYREGDDRPPKGLL